MLRGVALGCVVVACGSDPPPRDATNAPGLEVQPASSPTAKKRLSCGERLKPLLQQAKGDARAELEVYDHSCDAGCVEACERAALLFHLSFATDSKKDARTIWRYCELGSGLACALLGDRYKAGRGVELDPNHALELYERACGQESSLGCSGQARMLDFATAEADNVKRLEARAVELNERHCKQGDPFYCTLLADAHRDGRGVPKDMRRAIQLYSGACRSGLTLACNREKSLGP